MKHKAFALATSLFSLLLSGCHTKTDNDAENVIFPEITKDIQNGNLSEILSIRSAGILGSCDDVTIGRIKKIVKADDNTFIIQSSNSPIVIYDMANTKFTKIGEIGEGENEYLDPLDFDFDNDAVYVLTPKGIMQYGKDGQYIDTIKTDLNADGLHVLDDKIILFVLGDENVIHLMDKKGETLAEDLPRSVALRLSRDNSFHEYGDYILFHEGHSNDLFAYDRNDKSFHTLQILPEAQALSIEDEAELIEKGIKLPDQEKIFFDGLTTTGQQLCVGVMKDKKPFLYVGNDNNCTSISITDIDDDILYGDAISFFTKGVASKEKFVTYTYPYTLIENRDKILGSPTSPEVIKEIAGKVTENDNPIIIEYEFK